MTVPKLGRRPVLFFAACAATFGAQVLAQTTTAIPPSFARVPGNAELAMPARWSVGRMQTMVRGFAIPDEMRGATIQQVRLRRPRGGGALAARTVTLKLTLGTSGTLTPTGQTADVELNWTFSSDRTDVFGPSPVSLPALPAAARDDALGDVLVDVTLTTPFVVPTDPTVSLIVEWTAEDPAGWTGLAEESWVDGAWLTPGSTPIGYAGPIGLHGCGSVGTEPARLQAIGGGLDPRAGGSVVLRLEGVAAGSVGAVVFGLPSQGFPNGAGPFLLGNCPLWPDLTQPVVTLPMPASGTFSVDVPDGDLTGLELLAQAVGFETGVGLYASNAVLLQFDDIGVRPNWLSTVFLPGDGSVPAGSTLSPYGVFLGLSPVVEFVVQTP
jgi:hypothetical protein